MVLNNHLYFIVPQTNLHVGSGDAGFGIIDKLVQRDGTSELPIIHSSSLKGALREYFEEEVGYDKNSHKCKVIFGGVGQENQSGKYRFMNSEILFLPVRSNIRPYYLATSISTINDFVKKYELFFTGLDALATSLNALSAITGVANGNNIQPELPLVFDDQTGVYIEDYPAQQFTGNKSALEEVFFKVGKNICLMPDKLFKETCNSLPVIARNKLENGQSDNLWYEEVVPHKSIFYNFLSCPITYKLPEETEFVEFESHFSDKITNPSALIQIGGNGSVGYGICKFYKIA